MFTLDEAFEALNNRTEFAVKVYDGLICFDYIVVLPGSFNASEEEIRERAYQLWEQSGSPTGDGVDYWLQAEKDCKRFAAIRRNFRGVTFNEKTKEILSLPLHKFYNVNQIAETQFDLIKHYRARIYEKHDGSMVHFFLHNGELKAATCRSTESLQAKEATKLANKNVVLKEKILREIAEGWTPVMEFASPHNQIVVQYHASRLIYLVSRNRQTGDYRFVEDYDDKANCFEFDFADIYQHIDKTEFEGYVCHLENGQIVKCKTPWYMERHRAVDALMRPAYKLYGIVFEGIMDDLISIAAESYKPALMKIYEEAQNDLLVEKRKLEEAFSSLLEIHKKIPIDSESKSAKLAQLEHEVSRLKSQGKRLDAIKKVRDFAGIGLADAKHYVETGQWPHGFLQRDEQEEEFRRQLQTKSGFSCLVMERFPQDFSLLMAMFQGREPDAGIKERLLEVYKVKYPNKLYTCMEEK